MKRKTHSTVAQRGVSPSGAMVRQEPIVAIFKDGEIAEIRTLKSMKRHMSRKDYRNFEITASLLMPNNQAEGPRDTEPSKPN